MLRCCADTAMRYLATASKLRAHQVLRRSITVTLYIDIREKCLIYVQNLLNLVNSTIKS